MHRSSRLQSTNSTRAPDRSAASGVAMNVFDGHRTVSPATPARSSAARVPPAQDDAATAGASFHRSHAVSKRSVSDASDQRSESSTSSIRAWSRARSRWSNPIAKREKSGILSVVEAVVIVEIRAAGPRRVGSNPRRQAIATLVARERSAVVRLASVSDTQDGIESQPV